MEDDGTARRGREIDVTGVGGVVGTGVEIELGTGVGIKVGTGVGTGGCVRVEPQPPPLDRTTSNMIRLKPQRVRERIRKRVMMASSLKGIFILSPESRGVPTFGHLLSLAKWASP
jgi:hypothetical protein